VKVVVNKLGCLISVYVNRYSIAVRTVNMMILISIPTFVAKLMIVQMKSMMIKNSNLNPKINRLSIIILDCSILVTVVI